MASVMQCKLKSEDILKDVEYQKPTIKEEGKMVFPFEWVKNMSNVNQIACRQCSSCHGCR